ncbi:MAG TPA: hypothetical protein VMS60_09095 [Solirubrobacterales bacterium]|nr:hypothetical protein [Solirubrobacterales bacterium]
MNGRRAVVGLCMLCALLVSAFAAQSASAITGTTAVTCAKTGAKQVGSETFNTEHCVPKEGAGEYEHYEIAEKTTTELSGNDGGNPEDNTKLKATLGGVATTLTSTELSGEGSMENLVDEDGEHYAHGTGTITYTGVTISPFTKCFVYTHDGSGTVGAQGVVDTTPLTATTTKQGHGLKFEPVNKVTKVFAKFWILDKNKVGAGGECAIHGTYTVTGSVIATPDGATAKTTHTKVTEQNTLKMGTGEPTIKAGIEGSLTIKGRDKKTEEVNYTPLSVTTVET